MLLDLIKGNTDIVSVILAIPVILFSLSFHEYAHAWAANKMGDQTARNFGRLTLNPAKHLDPVGTLCMLFFGFGWAKPVPVNSRNFEKPKKGMALTAAAGPLSNLLLGFIGMFIFKIVAAVIPDTVSTTFQYNVIQYTVEFLYTFITMNVYLAVFNLLPVPPLDGSRLLSIVLPDKYYFGIMKYERYISLVIIVLLYTGLLSKPLSYLASLIIYGFRWLIGLLPFL